MSFSMSDKKFLSVFVLQFLKFVQRICTLIHKFTNLFLVLGRAPETNYLNLEKVGVNIKPDTGKIMVDALEATSVPNIFAIGDISEVNN